MRLKNCWRLAVLLAEESSSRRENSRGCSVKLLRRRTSRGGLGTEDATGGEGSEGDALQNSKQCQGTVSSEQSEKIRLIAKSVIQKIIPLSTLAGDSAGK